MGNVLLGLYGWRSGNILPATGDGTVSGGVDLRWGADLEGRAEPGVPCGLGSMCDGHSRHVSGASGGSLDSVLKKGPKG